MDISGEMWQKQYWTKKAILYIIINISSSVVVEVIFSVSVNSFLYHII